MPDTQEQQREQQQRQQWEQQNPGQTWDPALYGQTPDRSQVQIDSLFSEQMFGDTATREVVAQYFANAEDTLRSARRISEIYSMSLMKHHLITQVSQAVIPQLVPILTRTVTQQVVQQFQQNPQLLQQLMASAR